MSRAFVFPGQGAQTIGMGRALAEAYPAARAVFDEVDAALGEKLSALIWEGDIAELTLTQNAQPALMATSIAALRALEEEGITIAKDVAFVAGHSLGEYSALVASGVISLAQAVPLVRLRAQAMQEAVPVGTGAMAAVLGLSSDQVNAICQEAQDSFGAGSAEVVQAANFNDPGQTVISGSKAGVDKACELLKAAGAKRTLPLPVSAPFHCALMKPAAERLRVALADVPLQAPTVPVINNIDVASPSGADDIRDALYRQAFGPVRWVDVIRAMQQRGVTHVVECGPGKVLAGMTPRIDANLQAAPLYDPATLAQVQALLS
jgi:[acyl-carrier-protein] S-malonyltransferase